MITFNTTKEKKIKFALDIEGIDSKVLEYYIRLSSDNTDLGFKGNLTEGNILEFTIPALSDIIKESELKDIKNIKIEVHDKENKYYLRPFDDMVEFEHGPKAVTEMKDQQDKNKDIKMKMKMTEELDDNKPAPKSRISKFLK